MRIASTNALFFSTPVLMSSRIEIRIWMLSAIAKVKTIVGAVSETGVNRIPIIPPAPNATMVDKIITANVAKVALIERSDRKVIISSTPYMIGVSVCMSLMPDSANELFNMDTPLSAILMFG